MLEKTISKAPGGSADVETHLSRNINPEVARAASSLNPPRLTYFSGSATSMRAVFSNCVSWFVSLLAVYCHNFARKDEGLSLFAGFDRVDGCEHSHVEALFHTRFRFCVGQ